MGLKEIQAKNLKMFLENVDHVTLLNDSFDVDIDIIRSESYENSGLLPNEEKMSPDAFDSASLRFTFNDSKPWLVLDILKDGFKFGVSISPSILREWVKVIENNPRFYGYLPSATLKSAITPVEEAPKTPLEMKNELCPLGVSRKYAGTTGMCRACGQTRYKTGGETYNFRCTYDGWYDPFKEDETK